MKKTSNDTKFNQYLFKVYTKMIKCLHFDKDGEVYYVDVGGSKAEKRLIATIYTR